MSGYPFSGPIAPESNPPIEPQWFQPSAFPIIAIEYGPATTVTNAPAFGINNNYVIGQLVRLLIPKFFGAQKLNGQQAYVIDIPAINQVTLGINSIGYTPFNPSPSYSTTLPLICAIGDVNTGPINIGREDNGTTIQGAFINISPSAGG